MKKIRIAVLGGGHLGTIHARLLQQVSGAELCAIVDPDEGRAVELRSEFPCEIVPTVDSLLEKASVDAAIVAAPTTFHHELGTRLLKRGIHCLVEKPLAPSTQECRELVSVARHNNCILQVGHVERFNPAWASIVGEIGEPRIIEAFRESPLPFRSLDAGVVLDLMIHDIDLVLSLVQSPVTSIQAHGLGWTGPAEDFAQARITFLNGCIANLTASRISTSPRRQMRIFGRDWYSEVDFANRTCFVVDAPEGDGWQSRVYQPEERRQLMETMFDDFMPKHDVSVPEGNPLLDELCEFVNSIRSVSQPTVTGEAGLAAVDVANQVIQKVARRAIMATTDYPQRRRKAG